MEITFLIPNSYEAAERYGRVAKHLQKEGINSTFLTVSSYVEKVLKGLGRRVINVRNKKVVTPSSLEFKLAAKEREYDFSINEVLITDIEFSKKSRKKMLLWFYKNITFFENYLKKNKPDLIIGGLERIPSQMCQKVAKKMKIPYYIIELSVPIANKFCFTKNLDGHLSSVDEYFNQRRGKKISPNDLKKVKDYLKGERSKKVSHFIKGSRPVVNMTKIKFFFWMMYVAFIVEKNQNPYINIFRGLKNYLVKTYRFIRAKSLYKKADWKNDKIVYFPLHLAEDAQLLVRAPQYRKQEEIIEIISKSIPVDHVLYIKEHPCNPGDIKYKVLKRIAKLPNVKLIKYNISSRKIIKNSSCIVTICSSVGWESILLHKPVVNLGNVYYETGDLTIKVRDIYELRSNILKAIYDNPIKDDKKIIPLIDAMINATEDGNLILYNPYWTEVGSTKESMINTDAIETLTKSILNLAKKEKLL